MSNEATRLANYIRIQRRKAGFNQHELGSLVGHDARIVHRHERALVTPSLAAAIGYSIIFQIPVSELFAGLRDDVAFDVESKLAQLEQGLGQRSIQNRGASSTARKLIWLVARKSAEHEAQS